MPEILTESFCERCGTRYTFEAVAKPSTVTKLKVLSKGLKNYVLSDETSLDEALADARSEELRQVSGQQLDAFHKTFNFCMTCRQYTCANCWNQVEGRCLSCAPHLGHEILPAPFPMLETGPGATAANGHGNGFLHEHDAAMADAPPEAWPSIDLRRQMEEAPASFGVFTPDEPPASDLLAEGLARLELAAEEPGHAPSAGWAPEPDDAPEAASANVVDAVAPVAGDQIDGAHSPTGEDLQQVAASDEHPTVEQAPRAPADDRAAMAAKKTTSLLSRFRPARSADESVSEVSREAGEIAPAEPMAAAEPSAPTEPIAAAEPIAAETGPDLTAPEPEPGSEMVASSASSSTFPEGIDLAPELLEAVLAAEAAQDAEAAEAERAARVASESETEEPDRVAALAQASAIEVEHVAEAATEPAAETEPIAAAEAEPLAETEPIAAAETEPVAQGEPRGAAPSVAPEPVAPPVPPAALPPQAPSPVWQIVAPDSGAAVPPPADHASTPLPYAASAAPVVSDTTPAQPHVPVWPGPVPTPGQPPSWPTPQWPLPDPSRMAIGAIAPKSQFAQRSTEALWAASSGEVLNKPGNTGVQACVSCGLPLSANARFCRRCGSRQG